MSKYQTPFYQGLFSLMAALVKGRVNQMNGVVPINFDLGAFSQTGKDLAQVKNWFKKTATTFGNGRAISPRSIFHGRSFQSPDSNPSLFFNKLQNLNGAFQQVGLGNGSDTILDTKRSYSAISSNLDTTLDDYLDDAEMTIWDDYRLHYRFTSSVPFTIIPWLFLSEAGETYTASSSDSSDISLQCETGCPAQNYAFQYGDIRLSNVTVQDKDLHEVKITLDLTMLANLYTAHLVDKGLDEDDPYCFKLGFCYSSALRAGSSLVINYSYVSSLAYHKKKKELF